MILITRVGKFCNDPGKVTRLLANHHQRQVMAFCSRQRIRNRPTAGAKTVQTAGRVYRRVVIWGHKPFTHTHSFIHSSYYRAFRALGYDTYWFDNRDDVSGFDFSDCIFLTEDQVHQSIPLNTSSVYILHHCKLGKYIENNCRFINLCNYVRDCSVGKNFYYPGDSLEKLTYYSYFDKKNLALYQPWGTDLLPDQITGDPVPFSEKSGKVYYIGSVTDDNRDFMHTFIRSCGEHGKKLVIKTAVSDEKARVLVRESYISPDIRCQHHVNVGYMPCRIFKNISYGAIPATNALYCREFFDNTLPYSEDINGLFDANVEFLKDDRNKEVSRWLMNEVKTHHTYITRVNTIIGLIQGLY